MDGLDVRLHPFQIYMNIRRSLLVFIACIISPSIGHAEVIIFDFNVTTRDTLSGLGSCFVSGCALLAIGMVVAAKLGKGK